MRDDYLFETDRCRIYYYFAHSSTIYADVHFALDSYMP
jgi:hypothetical protein